MPVRQVTQIMSLVMTLLELVDAAVVLDATTTEELFLVHVTFDTREQPLATFLCRGFLLHHR